jgi:hypothetical protein
MNRAIATEIVRCLRVSGSPDADFSQLPVSRHQWERTLEWLDHSGIALLFWQRLKERGYATAIPSAVGERLERNLADHRDRVVEMVAEFASINRCFEGACLRYAAMKGLALSADYCPDIGLRTTYDYDYLLPRDSMEAAERALRAAGYIRKEDPEEHPVVYFHAARPPRTPLSRDDLYSKTFPRTVELHYLLWDADQVKIPLNLPSDPLAERKLRYLSISGNHQCTSGSARPVHFYELSEHDELIFQVLHAFRHILHDWCRLYSLLDIACFLDHRASDTAFWDQFLDRLGSCRPLSEIVGVVFMLASEVFGAPIPEPVSIRTVQSLRRPLVLWVERYGQESALSNFSDNKFSLFLHREFIHDEAAWRDIRRSRLFPIQRPNQGVHAADSSSQRARLSGAWKQGLYVSKRVRHHLLGTLRYGLEAPRWYRERLRGH